MQVKHKTPQFLLDIREESEIGSANYSSFVVKSPFLCALVYVCETERRERRERGGWGLVADVSIYISS